MKNIRFFYLKNFHFFGGKIFSIFEWACFRNVDFSPYLKLRYSQLYWSKKCSKCNLINSHLMDSHSNKQPYLICFFIQMLGISWLPEFRGNLEKSGRVFKL